MKIDQTFHSSHVSVSRWKIPVWFNPLVHLMVHEEGWATMPESPVLFTSIETKTHCGCYGYLLQIPTYTIPVIPTYTIPVQYILYLYNIAVHTHCSLWQSCRSMSLLTTTRSAKWIWNVTDVRELRILHILVHDYFLFYIFCK